MIHRAHSDIVVQVIAEEEGADASNKANEFDGIPINAILINGIGYELCCVSF